MADLDLDRLHEEIPTSDKFLRKAMLKVFGGRCLYTGMPVSLSDMHIDHIVPKSKGGRDCILNYALSSKRANFDKGAKRGSEFERVVLEFVRLTYAHRVANRRYELVAEAGGCTKRPYNTKTKRRTYTVTDEVHAELQRLGQGNASRGIREAVKQAKD